MCLFSSRVGQTSRFLIGMGFFLFGAIDELIWAGTYRCEDAAGVTVLTDSPVQLHNCSLVFPDTEHNKHRAPYEPGSPRPPEAPRPHIEQANEETAASAAEMEQEGRANHKTMNQEAIPITTVNGSIILSALLNDTRTARLILDTGATMTVLATDLAVELSLFSGSKNQVTTIQTAGGPVQVTLSRLDSVQVGSAIVHHVPVAIHDVPNMGPNIEGLLGMSFLRHFLLTLDAEHNRLYLRPRPASGSSP